MKYLAAAILIVLGLLATPQALSAPDGASAFQLWIFAGGYLLSGIAIALGWEAGAWGAIIVPAVALLVTGMQIAQAGGEVEIPAASWAVLAANAVALGLGILLLRGSGTKAERPAAEA